MSLQGLILLVLLSQTPHHKDQESWSERKNRLEVVAKETAFASNLLTCHDSASEKCQKSWPGSRKALAMALAVQAIFESRLAEHVHKNNCRLQIGECDAKKWFNPSTQELIYVQQSYSLWQIKKFNIPQDHWSEIQTGVPGTRYAALYAARRLSSGYRACGSLEGAFARYARGHGCQWEESSKRKALWEKFMYNSPPKKLQAAQDAIRKRLEIPPSSEETRIAKH